MGMLRRGTDNREPVLLLALVVPFFLGVMAIMVVVTVVVLLFVPEQSTVGRRLVAALLRLHCLREQTCVEI